ncbi:MAG: TraV family lipoprotein [Deltaproteobacteria bacterium]|nr:TraV family lipoprotein [Deltaproteobacteria bacterium]
MKSKNTIPKYKICLLFMMLAAFVLTTGCASILNPYDDEFQCPKTYEGQCTGIPNAYDMSVSGMEPEQEILDAEDEDGEKPQEGLTRSDTASVPVGAEYDYLNVKYEKMRSLIHAPATPLVVPSEVVRILILPYTGSDNNLFGDRHVYLFASQPGWVISSGTEIN